VNAGDSVIVRIANAGTAPVDDAVLRVVTPLASTVTGVDGAIRVAATGDFVALRLPRLAPGSRHVVTIHLADRGHHAR
jgi:hypothetical protein